jgi:hypothetical protein
MIGDTWLVEEVAALSCGECCFESLRCVAMQCFNLRVNKIFACGEHMTKDASKFTKRKVKHFDLTDEDIQVLEFAMSNVNSHDCLDNTNYAWFTYGLATIMFYYEVTGQCK